MKKTLKAISQISSAALFGALVLTSCSADKDSPGVEYMPDMYRSPSIEPFVDYGQVKNVESDSLSNLLSSRTPVDGTVPFYGNDFSTNMPFPIAPTAAFAETHGLTVNYPNPNGYVEAKAVKNPIMLHAGNEKAILKDAKHIYENNCIHCHGEKGDGKGSIVASGAYSGVPDYNGDDIKALADGQLMYSISYGKGMMGAHMTQLSTQERWKLVHYIRSLQNGGKADLDMNIGIDFSDSNNVTNQTGVLKDIYFNTGKTSINTRRANKSLFALLNFMSSNEDVKIELAGHTDNVGSDSLNVPISNGRAESVKSFLVEYGINGERISTVGYGSAKAIADNSTPEGRATNRRTEVRILK